VVTTASTSGWDAAAATGLVRLTAGGALIRFARPLARIAGAASDDDVVPAVLLGFGIRDTALGISAWVATRPGSDVRRQLALQAALDVVDTTVVVALIATGRLPKVRGALCAAAAVGSGIAELVTRRQLAPAA
jgi:hypothetical protein